MSDTHEYAELDELVKSPGWLRLMEHARQEWKEQLPARLVAAAELPNGHQEVLKVSHVAKEINHILAWPALRLATIERAKDVTQTSFSRGGYDTTASR